MHFQWYMSQYNWENLKDTDSLKIDTDCISNTYGQVRVGNLCIDILHSFDKNNWKPFGRIYALGVDTKYGKTKNGIPYSLIFDDFDINIYTKSFNEFKSSFEKDFENFLNKNEEYLILADRPFGNWN